MSNKTGTEDQIGLKRHREAWLKKMVSEFIKLEPSLPIENFLPDVVPAWVENVEREFISVTCPVAKLKKATDITPRKLGALLGHQCTMAVWMMEWISQESETPPDIDEAALTQEQLKRGEEFLDKLGEWYSALRRLAKRALATSVDQCYDDMNQFLDGYSQAFSKKPNRFGTGNFGSTTFDIYLFMLWFWRLVARLNSVHQLHQVLVQVYGSQRTGELKRIEKICQRIGLTYRKPGRPKIQTPA